MDITRQQARHFLIAYQGLCPPFPYQGKAGIMEYIRKVGCIQYDPLNIAGQNSDLVLQARVADYRPALLSELLYQDRLLIDGIDKVMSIYATQDWPYFERWRAAARRHRGRSTEAIEAAAARIRQAIAERGPLSSHELEMDEMVTWDWGSLSRLSRAVLESLYLRGELVVHHKVHTRKVYDLAQRCLPAELVNAPDPNTTDQEYHDWHVLRRVGSVGLTWNRGAEVWLGMAGVGAKERKAAIERLLEQDKLRRVSVEGVKEPFYYRAQDHAAFDAAVVEDELCPTVRLMAPLDNLLWDRRMLVTLFDFDYKWEVYVPGPKRRYGYYVLPVLSGDRFIARCEPVFDRKRAALVIKNWWWEAGIEPDAFTAPVLQALERFAEVLGAKSIEGDGQISRRT